MEDTKPRALIIDDDGYVADLLAGLFHTLEYDVRTEYSGDRGVMLAKNFRPSLALIDVMMPNMNGVELATVIRSELPDCRIVLLTADVTSAHMLMAKLQVREEFEMRDKPAFVRELLTRIGGDYKGRVSADEG